MTSQSFQLAFLQSPEHFNFGGNNHVISFLVVTWFYNPCYNSSFRPGLLLQYRNYLFILINNFKNPFKQLN